jgi:hypothetical protein
MCGRYGRRGDKQRIAEWMQTHNTDGFDEFDETNLAPSFNVAPPSFQPLVRIDGLFAVRRQDGMRRDAVVWIVHRLAIAPPGSQLNVFV